VVEAAEPEQSRLCGLFLYGQGEMGELGIILGKEAQALAFGQLELVGLARPTGADEPLPFGITGYVLDVSAGAVVERTVLD